MKKLISLFGVAFFSMLTALPLAAQIQLVEPTVTDNGTIFTVTMSLTDKNGNSLDASKLFFCVYVDDETSPVTIDKATWTYIVEDMTEIPYGYSDTQYYDIWSSEGTTSFYYYWSGFSRLGAQAIYHDGETTYKSAIAWTADAGGGSEPGGEGFDESQLISNPVGQKVETVRASTVFYRLGGTSTYSGEDTGAKTNYVQGADGNIYLLCVTGGNSTQNYLKLEYDGNNRYTAKMPQLVMIEEYDGVKYGFYASRMVKEEIADNPDSISYIISKTVPNEMDFILNEDGTLTMDAGGEDVILGLTYSDGYWTGFGDKNCIDTPAELLMNKLPEGAAPKKWKMEYQWANYPDFGTMKKFIDVAIVDNEIYINNPYNSDQEQWVKGTIDGNKAIFSAYQLLGPDASSDRYLYFRSGKLTMENTGYYSYADAENLVFSYDADHETLITDSPVSFYISLGYGQRAYTYNYDFPQFSAFHEGTASLQNPSFTLFSDDEVYEDYGYAYMQVNIPSTDSEGNALNTNNLYYSVYVNNANEPFTFTASEYSMDFTEDVTEIPFGHDGYDIYPYSASSDLRTIFFYFSLANVKMGIQSIYYKDNGDRIVSDIVWSDGSTTSDIASVYVDENSLDVDYYDLSGRRVTNPQAGQIYIRKMPNKTDKIIWRD